MPNRLTQAEAATFAAQHRVLELLARWAHRLPGHARRELSAELLGAMAIFDLDTAEHGLPDAHGLLDAIERGGV